MARLAKSLEVLRAQVDAKWPSRDKSSDGWIGDSAHAASKSDHNPNAADVVTAIDITNDTSGGPNARQLAETLVATRDPRIKYIISNAQIISSKVSPWVWRSYTGANAHRAHVHISVMAEPALYDDPRPWALSMPASTPTFPNSGKGSWYSQFTGKYRWVDTGDAPGSAALGVPDDAQGVAFYDRATLGKWFQVRSPSGKISIEQQTDIGPAPSTGRAIDISAAAAERFGYSPQNFPTDSIFAWRSIDPPANVAGLTPQQQAVAYRDLRGIDGEVLPPITPTEPVKPPAADTSNPLMLILLMLMMFSSKEKPMDPVKPGQPDLMALLLPLLVQMLTGKPLALPAPEPPPPPPPPPPPVQPDIEQLLKVLLPLLTRQPGATPVEPPKAPPPVDQPAITKPAVQVTGFASVVTILLQLAGILPASVGDTATTAGLMTTAVPVLATLLAPTGIFGTVFGGLLSGLSRLAPPK